LGGQGSGHGAVEAWDEPLSGTAQMLRVGAIDARIAWTTGDGLTRPAVRGKSVRMVSVSRRDLTIAIVSAMATTALVTVAFAQSPSKAVMHSTVFEWGGFKAEPTQTGARRECFDARTATLDRFAAHVTTLNPGEAPHPGHRHPEEELMIVKEGTLEAVQNDKTFRVGPGGMIFEASNEYHSVRNVGKTQAVYYVIKWVPPGLDTRRAE